MGEDEAVDALFALPPEEFTAARDALAKQLRSAGQREAAKGVRGLRRPSVVAWAVGQAARASPQALEELSAAAEEVVQVQRRALSGLGGGGEDLRTADRRRRTAVSALAKAAADVLVAAGRDPDPHRRALHDTFDAASLDPQARAQVTSGRLSKPLEPPSGFGAVAGLHLAPEPPEDDVVRDGPAPPQAEVDATDEAAVADEAAAARAAEAEARRRRRHQELADAARAAARAASQEAIDAERAARDADRAADAVEAELADITGRASAARREADTAADRARRARRAAQDAESAARAAEEREPDAAEDAGT